MKIEERYQALFGNGVFPITYFSLDGRILAINTVGARNLGGTPGDFIGKSIDEALPDAAQFTKNRIAQIAETGMGAAQFEDCLDLPSGKRWFSSSLQPVKDVTGDVVAVQFISLDITERKRAEHSLRESEERYRMIVENAVTPIVYQALDGTILLINAAGARNLGGVPSDFIGKPIDEVLPDAAQFTKDRIAQIAETGVGAAEFEDCVELPSGERWFSSNLQPVKDATGKVIAVQFISLDITERKRAEKSLRDLSRRLIEVQEIERRHIARELHDQVGQALTGLKFSLEMAVHDSAANPRANLSETTALIDDLMTRVRALSLDLRPSMLDDLGLLPALLWHFKRYSAQTGVGVVFQHQGLESRFPPDVETAAYRIIQEALTNVARHGCVREVTVRILADQRSINLQIKDQGIGFDVESVLSRPTSSGLAGMRERTVPLGGQFTVFSEPGHGTELIAELPFRSSRPERHLR